MCRRLRAGPRQGRNNPKVQGNVLKVRRQRSCVGRRDARRRRRGRHVRETQRGQEIELHGLQVLEAQAWGMVLGGSRLGRVRVAPAQRDVDDSVRSAPIAAGAQAVDGVSSSTFAFPLE